MLQFRPISLCNAAYKIISKMIVNKLQLIMQEIISPYEHVFVKGRIISDNTFLAAEIVNYVHKARKVKIGWGVAKIDLFKAYIDSTRLLSK